VLFAAVEEFCKSNPPRIDKVIAMVRVTPFLTHDVDAAYCYRLSCVVCLSVTVVSHAKAAESIKIQFRFRTRMGPRNHVLGGGPDPQWVGGAFEGEIAAHCKV